MGNAWSLPEPTTTAEPVLELTSEGLNRATANGWARLSHRLIVQMVAMVLKVVYFPSHDLGWAGAFPVQSVSHRPEVLARMMKVQSLYRAGKAVLRQIPEPDRPHP